jgi:hypothetical protein
MPLYAPPPVDLGLLRATGSIAPPLLSGVRVESAGTSGYQYLTQGIRAETEIVINIQQRGDFETSFMGQYTQTEVVVNDPSGSYTVTTLSLDNGGGVGAQVTVQTDEGGSFLTDEERALIEEQRQQQIAEQQYSYLAQAAPEYQPPELPTYESVNYYDPLPVYEPWSGYQAPETHAPVAQPEVQSLPQEQAPVGGCETRVVVMDDGQGGSWLFEEHDGGGGSWSSVG